MTARAITPIHPATILPAPEEAVLEELELDPVEVLLALLLSDEAVASLVEEAVEEASVAVAVDEPVVVLLALTVVLTVAEEVATAVERVDDTLDKVYVTGVPEDVEEAAVEDADELEVEEEVVPSVMLNWFYIAPKESSAMVSKLVHVPRSSHANSCLCL